MTELNDLAVSLDSALSDLEPIQHTIGRAGKDAAHLEFERALGPDRAFSGLGRKVPLSAGYDLGRPVTLNLRPKGLVILADKGRRRTTRITPKRRRRGRAGRPTALAIPGVGYRRAATSRPSRGHDVVNQIVLRCDREVPDAVDRMIGEFIAGRLR